MIKLGKFNLESKQHKFRDFHGGIVSILSYFEKISKYLWDHLHVAGMCVCVSSNFCWVMSQFLGIGSETCSHICEYKSSRRIIYTLQISQWINVLESSQFIIDVSVSKTNISDISSVSIINVDVVSSNTLLIFIAVYSLIQPPTHPLTQPPTHQLTPRSWALLERPLVV